MPVRHPSNDITDHLHSFVIPILDIHEKQVARILVTYDDHALEKGTKTHLQQVVIATILIATFLGLLFHRLLLRLEGNLRNATSELYNNEQRTRAILDTALDAIISIDTNGCILEFNKAAEKIFGFQREDVLGQEISKTIIPPELREPHCHGLARYLTTGEQHVINQHIELEAINANGLRIPVEIAITVIPGTASLFFTAYLRDISERKQLLVSMNDAMVRSESSNLKLRQEVENHEQTLGRLQSSEERFRSVTMSIQDAVIAADQEQTIIFWNHGAEVLFGYTQNEILGKKITLLIPQRYRISQKKGFHRFMKQGSHRFPEKGDGFLPNQSTVLAGLRKNGQEFPLEISFNAWADTDGTPFFSAVIRDITERIRQEKQTQRFLQTQTVINALLQSDMATKRSGAIRIRISDFS